ncbi:hypothetical protein ES708_30474 [subsurface metagenome]
MMFRSPRWIIGAALGLESMRRGFIGGTSLALFIDLSGMGQGSCQRDLRTLEAYRPIEEALIDAIPDFLVTLIYCFEDYHLAAVCFYETAKELCLFPWQS